MLYDIINKNLQEVKIMNRQNRRHPTSPMLPAFYASKKSIISENKKRKNETVNSKCFKNKKVKRGF